MLKEFAKIFVTALMLLDGIVILTAFLLSYIGCFLWLDTVPSLLVWFLLPGLLLIWGIALNHFGMYQSFRVRPARENALIIFKAALATLVFFGFLTYVLKIAHVSRMFIVLDFIVTVIFLCIEKFIMVFFFWKARQKGFNYRQYLVVGTGPRTQKFINMVHDHSEWGLRIVGLVDKDSNMKGKTICGIDVLGDFNDIPELIQNNAIDEVIFVVPRSWLGEIEEILHFLEIQGVKVSVAVDYFALKLSRAKQTDFHGMPLITFESAPDKIWHLFFKRIVDIFGSLFGLILLSPVLAVVALLVRQSSKGPVFFKQKRSGLNGRVFVLYKFRTMVPDAEAKLAELQAHNEMDGPVFKMENDPRITALGKFLRKYSLDELPQLWNVLKGDMSLIGPRPPIPSEVAEYEPWQRRRLSMRPGLSCLWQIKGRNTITDFDEWMRLDLEYIDNWSLFLDFKILLLTIPAVVFASGAK